MNKVKLFIVFILFYTFSTYAKKRVASFVNVLKENQSKIKNNFTVVDKKSNLFSYTLEDSKHTYNYLFNEHFNQISEFKSDEIHSNFDILQGSSIHDNLYNLYFSSNVFTLSFFTFFPNICAI